MGEPIGVSRPDLESRVKVVLFSTGRKRRRAIRVTVSNCVERRVLNVWNGCYAPTVSFRCLRVHRFKTKRQR